MTPSLLLKVCLISSCGGKSLRHDVNDSQPHGFALITPTNISLVYADSVITQHFEVGCAASCDTSHHSCWCPPSKAELCLESPWMQDSCTGLSTRTHSSLLYQTLHSVTSSGYKVSLPENLREMQRRRPFIPNLACLSFKGCAASGGESRDRRLWSLSCLNDAAAFCRATTRSHFLSWEMGDLVVNQGQGGRGGMGTRWCSYMKYERCWCGIRCY